MAQIASHPLDSEQTMLGSGRKWSWKRGLWLVIPLSLLAVGLGVRHWLMGPEAMGLQLSGRIEGYDTQLGVKVGGRVVSIAVREGDTVQAGQVVAQLDDSGVQAQVQQAVARVAAARQQVLQTQMQVDVVATQIVEAQLIRQQAQGDAAGRVSQSAATVAAAQAQLSEAEAQVQQAEATLRLARLERDRFATLVDQGVIAQQQFDQVQAQFELAQEALTARQAAVMAAQKQVDAAQGALAQAQTSQINPEIRLTQINRLYMQQQQAQVQLVAAEAELAQAQGAEAEARSRLKDLEITSPITGVVTTRTTEPGEVVAPGTSLLSVVNLNQVYLRGYIPQGDVGRVRVGQPAQVFLDSAPDRPLAATVAAIDTEASFTPENIYFRDDRITQVFGLKLAIQNPDGFAKPGMPADGKILVSTSEAAP